MASVQVTVAPFCIFPARHRGHDFDPLVPLFLPLFLLVVCDRPRTFTFAIPLRPRVLHPPRLLPVVRPTLGPYLQPKPCTLDATDLPRIQDHANITVL